MKLNKIKFEKIELNIIDYESVYNIYVYLIENYNMDFLSIKDWL